jgi:hypothetical protein
MKRVLAFSFLASIFAVGLAACGDPVVGTWTGQTATTCGTPTTFTVKGDLNGTGTSCGCQFTFIIDPTGPGTYDADVNFESGCFALDGHYTCTLRANDQELDCGILGNYDRGGAV